MSEREKEIMEKLGKVLPNMNDFNKGYLLGLAEASAKEQMDQKEKAQLVQQ